MRAPLVSNADVEARWVEAWDELLGLSGKRHDFRCMLPDGAIVDVETCLGWIRESVYAGCFITVRSCWLSGRPGALVSRSENGSPAPQ